MRTWEDGSRSPGAAKLAQVADALDTTTDYLITGRQPALAGAGVDDADAGV